MTDFRSIGLAIALIVFLSFAVLLLVNTRKARDEVGSEIELAANRKEYFPDEVLEGNRLDRSLGFALVMLLLISVVFVFYMIAEPGRQDGAQTNRIETFQRRGADNYVNAAQCVNCHAADGSGGGAAYVLQDADGQFLANATWQAPALNNVLLRYSEEEITHILNFGRTGSPMAAWGAPGGGPLTSQAVQNTIEYLKTLQVQSIDTVDIAAAGNDVVGTEADDLTDEASIAAQAVADGQIAAIREEVARSITDGEFANRGEAVFNLGLYSGFGAGSYSCGRCHTAGWSLGADVSKDVLTEGVAACGGGVSGIGFNLCGGSISQRFPDDTWKRSDGTWAPPSGLFSADGEAIVEALDGTEIKLDDRGRPLDASGQPYIVLGEASATAPSTPVAAEPDVAVDDSEAVEESTEAAPVAVAPAPAASSGGSAGDLASCSFVSGLYTPDDGATYAIDPDATPVVGEDGIVADPAEIELADLPGAFVLASGRIASDCTIIEMPARTSKAHYDFIYDGAQAGVGYGVGGQSSAGMMPGFGKMLPPDLIQAVVDYERGLE